MKLDPYKFVGKDWRRPTMQGVFYANGYVTATDAFCLVHFKAPYPEQYEGKIIKKDGSRIEGKYPNISGVIPDKSNLEPYQVNVDELTKLYNDSLKKNKEILSKTEKYERQFVLGEQGRTTILFVDPYSEDGNKANLGFDVVKKLIHYLKATGTDTLWISKKPSRTTPVMAYSDNSLALFMPYSFQDEAHHEYSIRITPEAWVWRSGTSKKKATATAPATRPAKAKAKAKTTTATKPTAIKTTAMRRTRKTATRKPATKKSGNTIKKAATILAQQKADWQKIFRSEVKKKNVNSKAAAKKAGSVYRSKYGSTPSARWKNAIREAKR